MTPPNIDPAPTRTPLPSVPASSAVWAPWFNVLNASLAFLLRSFRERVTLPAPNSATPSVALDASQFSVYLNEAGNALTFKVKYSDGSTVKSGTIALT